MRALAKDEQVAALLTGVWPIPVNAENYREVLTAESADVAAYLKAHPGAAEAYLKKWEAVRDAADLNLLWAEGDSYTVAWSARGGRRSAVQRFSALPEAVAEHVRRHNGLLK